MKHFEKIHFSRVVEKSVGRCSHNIISITKNKRQEFIKYVSMRISYEEERKVYVYLRLQRIVSRFMEWSSKVVAKISWAYSPWLLLLYILYIVPLKRNIGLIRQWNTASHCWSKMLIVMIMDDFALGLFSVNCMIKQVRVEASCVRHLADEIIEYGQ